MKGILLLGIVAWAQDRAAVNVRPHTYVSEKGQISLGHIAEFRNISPVVAEQMRGIKLVSAPQEGERVEFSGAALSQILRSRQVTRWVDAHNIYLEIPNKVLIENIGNKPTGEKVRKELIDFYSKICECRIQVDDLTLPKLSNWKAGSKWRLTLQEQRLRGATSIPMIVTAPDGETMTYWIRARLSHHLMVPVAKRMIRAGERIQIDDIDFKVQDITFLRDGVPGHDDLIGRKVRQPIAVNQIIGASLIEKEKAIHRGDQVRVMASDTGFDVAVIGVAESDAFIGDTITLKNRNSQQKIMARVIGKGEARIE